MNILRKIVITFMFITIVAPLAAQQDIFEHKACALENCSGLDVSCAMVEYPRACSAMYMVGDFCREFVRCEMINDQCQLIKDLQFDGCVACVTQCVRNAQAEHPLECEQRCRQQFQSASSF